MAMWGQAAAAQPAAVGPSDITSVTSLPLSEAASLDLLAEPTGTNEPQGGGDMMALWGSGGGGGRQGGEEHAGEEEELGSDDLGSEALGSEDLGSPEIPAAASADMMALWGQR